MSVVHAAIASRFCPPQWATFFEVRDAAGFKSSRSADAVAMNTWPSRGLEVYGFEVKVSRSDWLRELKDPSKSAPVQRFCDRWYVCVDDANIVKGDELPATWGLMVLKGKTLVTAREAPKLESLPLTRDFIACLLRRATEDVVPKVAVDAIVSERVDAAVADRVKYATSNQEENRYKRLFQETDQKIRAFEEASGVKVRDYVNIPSKIGAAVRHVLGGNLHGNLRTLEHAASIVKTLAAQLDAAHAELTTIDQGVHVVSAGAADAADETTWPTERGST